MKNNMRIVPLFLLLIFSAPLYGLTPGEVMDGEIEKTEFPVIQLPTQFGPIVNFSYNMENLNGSSPLEYWGIGPGVFFDYNLQNIISLSADFYYIFTLSDVQTNSYLKPGVYIKRWLNKEWGYVGLGLQGNIVKRNGVSAFSLDLTLLLTGENVFIQKGINSAGDLRISLGILEPLDGITLRFQYTIGFGFDLQ